MPRPPQVQAPRQPSFLSLPARMARQCGASASAVKPDAGEEFPRPELSERPRLASGFLSWQCGASTLAAEPEIMDERRRPKVAERLDAELAERPLCSPPSNGMGQQWHQYFSLPRCLSKPRARVASSPAGHSEQSQKAASVGPRERPIGRTSLPTLVTGSVACRAHGERAGGGSATGRFSGFVVAIVIDCALLALGRGWLRRTSEGGRAAEIQECGVGCSRREVALIAMQAHNIPREFSVTSLDASWTNSVDAATVQLIDMDLHRTLSDNVLVRSRQGWIRSMLLRHVATDPELGYCQGMTLVAAIFAAASSNGSEAYSRFEAFTGGVRSLWMPGFPLLKTAMKQFETVAQAQGWYKHLLAHGIDTSMYLPQALLTLFGSWLSLPTLLECLGLLENSGMTGMVAMAVTVLDLAGERLLKQSSMEDLLFELQSLRACAAPEPHALIAGASRALPRVEAIQAGLRPRSSKLPTPMPKHARSEHRKDRTVQEW
eukprot:CAMPEP_0204111004 /NCGR_PEP_ID=MMETSP0361-20130328/2211_1 /ASSEMBLY_ACC=CAM_ASM_000343 /TAXON_ID=268821 /ORGANISM="Scrippsiella Hangoei, Strain SHTV-5" /LENGTH=489 /DNA_ID=CAMNT_0051060997 /DNA_START=8 /DNA_END=1475 /DNA_ORIENTATION=+